MPNSKQAAKRMRQNETQRNRNRARKSQIRTHGKRVLAALEKGDIALAKQEFSVFQTKVDKAAKTRSIHPNAASRKKARMMAQINAKATAGS
ncbi:MAG: 30S ribosomal protein S20 [Planctomycetota bacterium]